ncbi:flagellar M-ring protein FliF C-terminal domain-containing protein [Hansschlegelia beijingensis]
MDRTKSTLTSDVYDPESKVVRSTQTREETSQSTEPAEQGVTVANQLPNAQQSPTAQQARDASNKTEEVVNYEISRTTRTEVQDGGRLKRCAPRSSGGRARFRTAFARRPARTAGSFTPR